MNSNYEKNMPLISIGLPVYNGEKSIINAIESLLSQTISNFELIISDNASTDSTESICKKMSNMDPRIKYFHQKKNNDALWNFNFVLKQAVGEFFMWAAADDVWHPEFLEKNIEKLKSDNNIVGSISEIKFYYEDWTKNDFNRFKNTNVPKKYELVHPITGKYEDKVNFVFDFNHPQCIYSIFRTEKLKKCTVRKKFGSWDYAVILKILQYGDISVVDKLLMYMYRGHKKTEKNTTLYDSLRQQKISIIKSLFPFVPLTFWCLKNIGLKKFIKNFGRFVKMNYRGQKIIIKEIISKLKK